MEIAIQNGVHHNNFHKFSSVPFANGTQHHTTGMNQMTNLVVGNTVLQPQGNTDTQDEAASTELDHPIKIFTLGRFSILINNKPIDFNGKGQRKALELLKTLIALGGREVGEVRICEALWPDSDGDVAHTTFSVTLHRLRKLVGNEALILSDGRLTLNANICWVDTWLCERLLGQIKHMNHTAPAQYDVIMALMYHALNLYHGPYLGNEDEQAWFLSYRQRLHNKLLHTILQVSSQLENANQCEIAISLYESGLNIDDLSESAYLRLMKCYIKLGRRADALAVYQRCKATIKAHYGLEPSAEMQSLIRSLDKCA